MPYPQSETAVASTAVFARTGESHRTVCYDVALRLFARCLGRAGYEPSKGDRQMRANRVLTMALLALVAALVMAVPASAESKRHHFSLSTAGQGSAGYATASGKLVFNGPHRVTVRGEVNDICPANGFGAYVYLVVIFRNGNLGIAPVGNDNDTCDEPTQPFSKTVNFGKKVVKARVYLQEEDRDTGMPRDALSRSHVWGNPYVGG